MDSTRMNVQFGAGGTQLDGFQNHDIEVPIQQALPYGDNSVEMIVASHVMEHVAAGEALGFLMECHRILEPGGRVRISCPIVGQWLDRDHARDLTRGHGHQIILNEQLMRDLFWMAGFDPQKVRRVDLDERYDTHWREIGRDKDQAESCRMEAEK